jgi:hypothetical protein
MENTYWYYDFKLNRVEPEPKKASLWDSLLNAVATRLFKTTAFGRA